MGFTTTTDNIEFNGGGIGVHQIDTSSYSAPAAYSDYVEIEPTDGIDFEYEAEEELIYCDQQTGAIDSFIKVTRASVEVMCMTTTMKLLALAFNGNSGFTTGVAASSVDYDTSLSDVSIYGGGGITTSRSYMGKIRSKKYFDLQWEKPMSHDTSKVLGFRLVMAGPRGNFTWTGKHGEQDYWSLVFDAYIFTLDDSQPYYEEFGYWFAQTS